MSAIEGASTSSSTSTSIGTPRSKPYAVSGVSMRDLLASCAAARAISTPPRPPEAPVRQQPKAA
ncbi:hypothetical protein G3I71_34875 [Streptomyces sp. SID12501]|uniref:Uncharacterized protein n=1 Tax=Streptomyces sp. SID12501 TaxID=2706042 RepID=A0A6B3C3P9_9ACTN|nr:hypothetical protein [Streptomyces sp. SID12501]NEC90870.1 hypothetical protein [Streptomyces sp. SID12501]